MLESFIRENRLSEGVRDYRVIVLEQQFRFILSVILIQDTSATYSHDAIDTVFNSQLYNVCKFHNEIVIQVNIG